MTRVDRRHTPLLSGLAISSQIGPWNSPRRAGGGTLTGLARRNSDGKKMLVTCLHVMAGKDNGNYKNPTGQEKMYQGLANRENIVGTDLT